jgi:outer membrane protein assembly factor BamB
MSARQSLSSVPPIVLLGLVAGCTANVNSVSPTAVAAAGPAFKMTVLGTGFTQSSTVQWNGANRTTTYVSATELLAQINTSDIASTGSASITVNNPGAIGGTSSSSGSSGSSGSSTTQSNAKTINILAPSVEATDYQIDPAHDGAMTFTSTVSFPTSGAAWSVNLGSGTPSNIVIADGMVFLTTGTSSGSTLFAVNQTTGATAWGPSAIAGISSGSAGVAYDGGRVFVAEAQSGAGTLYAYDASSGALDWSTGIGSAPGAPTAADGLVYVISAGSATLSALDETKGTITWQQSLSSGGAAPGTPAITADGVYVTATAAGCFAIDFRPATGEVIWNNSNDIGSCPQGTAGTPAVANQVVYSPTSSGTSTFDSEAGTSGATLADSLPAAFTSSMGYFVDSPNLDGINLSTDSVQWTFNGDSQLDTPPVVVADQAGDQFVVTGSSIGHLYVVEASSGSSVWTQTLSGKVEQLAVGDGLLVVVTEVGNDSAGTLTAYTISAGQ